MFALVDCNNFYTACERLFRPDLKGKPIVVLSNNDGCVISRSTEAKAIGIEMGAPTHTIRDFLTQHGVEVCSSNYALYADLSERIMESLRLLAPKIEVYSIDEAFLDLHGMATETDLSAFGLRIKSTLYQWVGLPVCVGIAPTKTLAKLANHAAKKKQHTSGNERQAEGASLIQRLAEATSLPKSAIERVVSCPGGQMYIGTLAKVAVALGCPLFGFDPVERN